METVKTLQDAILYFSDPDVCVNTVASLRWPDGPVCPACEGKSHWFLKTQRRWKCKDCHKQFTVKLGTIFEDSPLGLDKWLVTLWQLVNCKNGVSSYEIAAAVGVTQKSAWFMLHRLRLALKHGSVAKLGGPGVPVEADETYIGAEWKNVHKSRKLALRRERNATTQPNTRYPGKIAVFGMIDRESRKVRAVVVPHVKRAVLQNEILNSVAPGSRIHTDESMLYDKLSKEYVHEVVNHLKGYVDGEVSTNGLENFWSLLKRSLGGTYVSVEPFHLQKYADEQVFRFNHRKDAFGNKLTPCERFTAAMGQIAGKRMTYAELTGKTETAESF